MAMAAAGAALCYWLLAAVGLVGIVVSIGDVSLLPFLAFAAIGLVQGIIGITVVVAPLAFVVGVAVWRVVPESQRFGGAIGGLLTTVLVYLVPGVVGVGVAVVAALATGGPLLESLGSGAAVLAVAFLATAWAALPLGVLSGTLYERSRAGEF